MRHGRFWALRQDNTDPIPTPDAEPEQGMGQLIGTRPELGEGVGADVAGIVFVEQGQTRWVIGMAVTDVHANIKSGRDVPAEAGVHLGIARSDGQQALSHGPLLTDHSSSTLP